MTKAFVATLAVVVVLVLVAPAAAASGKDASNPRSAMLETLSKIMLGASAKQKEAAKAKAAAEAQAAVQAAATLAAQQQAYVDALAFQQAMLAHQQREQLRHRRHRVRGKSRHSTRRAKRHRRHRRHHSHAPAMPFAGLPGMLPPMPMAGAAPGAPAAAPSFFEQYYSMAPGGYNPYMAQMQQQQQPQPKEEEEDDEDEAEEKQRSANRARAKKDLEQEAAAQARFRQTQTQQPPQQQQPQAPSLLEYGDPFNSGGFAGAQPPRAAVNNDPSNAYGPPMEGPTDGPASYFASSMAMPHLAPGQPMVDARQQLPNLATPRFRETQANAQTQGGFMGMGAATGNPNPSGVPMPFYAPNQAPPPAPNQIPAPNSMVNGVYPMNLRQVNSGQFPPAGAGMVQSPGLNTAAVNFSPYGAHQDINAYPFNSFVELESVVTNAVPRRALPEVPHRLVHAEVHKAAQLRASTGQRTPLLKEHTEPFPLL